MEIVFEWTKSYLDVSSGALRTPDWKTIILTSGPSWRCLCLYACVRHYFVFKVLFGRQTLQQLVVEVVHPIVLPTTIIATKIFFFVGKQSKSTFSVWPFVYGETLTLSLYGRVSDRLTKNSPANNCGNWNTNLTNSPPPTIPSNIHRKTDIIGFIVRHNLPIRTGLGFVAGVEHSLRLKELLEVWLAVYDAFV